MRAHSKHCTTSFSKLPESWRTRTLLSSIVFHALFNGPNRFSLSSFVEKISTRPIASTHIFTLTVDTEIWLLEKPRESREIYKKRASQRATARWQLRFVLLEHRDVKAGTQNDAGSVKKPRGTKYSGPSERLREGPPRRTHFRGRVSPPRMARYNVGSACACLGKRHGFLRKVEPGPPPGSQGAGVWHHSVSWSTPH